MLPSPSGNVHLYDLGLGFLDVGRTAPGEDVPTVAPGSPADPPGATRPHHLAEAVGALDIELTGDEVADLEKNYIEYGPSWY